MGREGAREQREGREKASGRKGGRLVHGGQGGSVVKMRGEDVLICVSLHGQFCFAQSSCVLLGQCCQQLPAVASIHLPPCVLPPFTAWFAYGRRAHIISYPLGQECSKMTISLNQKCFVVVKLNYGVRPESFTTHAQLLTPTLPHGSACSRRWRQK